jgi:hypothetical protein
MTVNGNHSAPAAANRMNRPPAGGLKVVLEDVRLRGGSGENQGWNDEPLHAARPAAAMDEAGAAGGSSRTRCWMVAANARSNP